MWYPPDQPPLDGSFQHQEGTRAIPRNQDENPTDGIHPNYAKTDWCTVQTSSESLCAFFPASTNADAPVQPSSTAAAVRVRRIPRRLRRRVPASTRTALASVPTVWTT